MIGDYCAGRDQTREGYINPLHEDVDYSIDHLDEHDFEGDGDMDGHGGHYYDKHHEPHAHIPKTKDRYQDMILNLES